MPVGKISFNIHAQGVRDVAYLTNLMREIDPAACLVMDGLSLLLDLKSSSPNMIAIDREYPDVDVLRETPDHWLMRKDARIGDADVWCYTTNEPMLTPEVVQWHVKLLKLNAQLKKPLKIVGLNLGVGQPNDWSIAKELLQLADTYRSWFILGLHEYAAVVPTSGFKGGTPFDQNYARADQWPRGAELTNILPPRSGMFHCGRVFALNDYCNKNGITPPRVILTEHGFDHLNDIPQSWYNSLQMTSPYKDIQGWKTLVNEWRVLFPQWSEGRALFECLSYLDSELYKGSNVEAQLVYCWGYIDRQWEAFDVSGNTVFHSFLKDYVRGLLMTTPITPSVPRPNPAGASYKGKMTTSSRVRTGNGTSFSVLYTAAVGDEVLFYPQSVKPDSLRKYDWVWVEPTNTSKSAGWVALVVPISDMFEVETVVEPPQETQPTPPPFPPNIDIATLSHEERLAVAKYLDWVSDVATYISVNLRKDS